MSRAIAEFARQLQRLLVRVEGFIGLAQIEVGPGQVVERHPFPGAVCGRSVEVQGLAKAVDRCPAVPLAHQRLAFAHQGIRLRFERGVLGGVRLLGQSPAVGRRQSPGGEQASPGHKPGDQERPRQPP